MIRGPSTRLILRQSAVAVIGALVGASCAERHYERVPPPPPREVVVDGPVIDGPGVEVVEVEPPPAERVYVYDPGYPPGVYFYNNYYWYGGYRYPHDVFVHRYVEVNVRQRRYINVEQNRRMGQRVEVRNREDFARYHGAHPGRPAPRPGARPGPHDRERD